MKRLSFAFVAFVMFALVAIASCGKDDSSSNTTIAVNGLEFSTEKSFSLVEGEREELTFSVLPENATIKDVDYSVEPATGVVSITEENGVLAIVAVGDGTATITFKAANGVEDEIVVTVQKYVAVTGITLINDPTNTSIQYRTIANGTTPWDFDVQLTGENGEIATSQDVVWSSNDTSVATIDPKTGVVTPVGAGETTFTATSTDNAGITKETQPLNVVIVADNMKVEYSTDGGVSFNTIEQGGTIDVVVGVGITLKSTFTPTPSETEAAVNYYIGPNDTFEMSEKVSSTEAIFICKEAGVHEFEITTLTGDGYNLGGVTIIDNNLKLTFNVNAQLDPNTLLLSAVDADKIPAGDVWTFVDTDPSADFYGLKRALVALAESGAEGVIDLKFTQLESTNFEFKSTSPPFMWVTFEADKLKYVKNKMFEENYFLKSVNLPKAEYVEADAFEGTFYVEELRLPMCLDVKSENSFDRCAVSVDALTLELATVGRYTGTVDFFKTISFEEEKITLITHRDNIGNFEDTDPANRTFLLGDGTAISGFKSIKTLGEVAVQ